MPHAITGSARKRPLFINLIGTTALALAVSLATPGLAQDNRAGDPTPAPPEGPAGAAGATIPRLVTFSGIVDPQMMQLNQSPAGSTGKARLRLNGAADFLPLPGAAGRQAQDNHRDTDASRIKVGFKIAPVPLNLDGKDPDLVGLGSYWVNAVSDCNFCHTAGGPPNYNFAAGFNPYFAQPKKTDPTTYLAGGTDFGPALPLGFYEPGYGNYVGPDIVSRNLTPDKTGMPEGGHTFEQFKQIFRTGVDLDHLHPTCITPFPVPTPANCIPPPVDGSLLQVMPWPNFQDMTDHDIRAIYEYLSAIPCIAGPTAPSPLHNDCGDDQAVGADDVSEAPHRTRR